MNIILTGLRGSGKSKIGKLLSKKLNLPFIDIDQEIEKIANKKIAKVIEESGWKYFRKLETEVTKSLASNKKISIISTGGGTIINPENAKILKTIGSIIYLQCPPQICAKRIKNDPNRPKLTNKNNLEQEMEELNAERDHIYKKHSHIIFQRSEDANKDAIEIIKLISVTQ